MITNATASAALKKKAIKKLEIAAKQTGAVATQCIAAAQGAGASNRNDASQQQLINHCKVIRMFDIISVISSLPHHSLWQSRSADWSNLLGRV